MRTVAIYSTGAKAACLIACLAALLMLAACKPKTRSNVVLKVGGTEITKSEVRIQLAYMGLGGDPAALTPELRKAALDAVAQRYLLILEAREKGITLLPEELESEEFVLRGQMDEKTFEQALTEQGLEYYEWRKVLEGDLLARKMLDLVVSSQVRVSVEEIKDYYQHHQDEFKHQEQILAYHIVLPTKTLANKVRSSLKSGKELDDICRELGITAPDGGQSVWLEAGHMPQDFERRVFKIQPGQVSGPFKSEYGYHVFKVMQKRKSGTSSLAEASEIIQQRLTEERKQELAERWTNELNRKTEVWFNPDFLENGHSTGS